MFAVVALIVFILALFKVAIGSIDLVVLGLALIAAHLAFGGYVTLDRWRRPGA
jgi:hypothetical protein